jgi:hypothetical protein
LLPTERNQGSKEQQLDAAGISTSTANEYEQLVAPTEELEPTFEELNGTSMPFLSSSRRTIGAVT